MSELVILGSVVLFVSIVVGYKKPAIGLVAAPFLAVAVAIAATRLGPEEGILYAPVVFVVTLAAVAASAHASESIEWYHRWAFRVLIALAAALLLSVVLVGFQTLGAGFVLPVFFLLGIGAIIISLIGYGMVSRRAAALNVFSVIGASMRQNLPLAMALEYGAVGRTDATGSILRKTKTWLIKGYSLSAAIRMGYPECPSRALALLVAGEQIGQLPAAIQAIERDMKSRATERTRLRPVHPFYPLVVLGIAFFLILGLMTFVMPQFKAVLAEMTEGPLPRPTRVLMEVTVFVAYKPGPIVLFVPIGLLVLASWARSAWRKRRPEQPFLVSRLGDSIKWHLPIVHWFERNRSMLQLVELLRMSLDAGRPVNEAIRSALALDVNLFFRKRIDCWLARVERGEDIGGAARACRLGRPLAWAFDRGAGTGKTPAVLEMLESHYRFSYSYRVNLARFILWPLAIIALGLTVGCIVYAVFTPVVATLQQMTVLVYP